MSSRDDDFLSSQIEPPTFIIEFNDPDQTFEETNEFIQEIERAAADVSTKQIIFNGINTNY